MRDPGNEDEVTSLNADDLDVTELEDDLLEHAAGGGDGECQQTLCWDFTCGSNCQGTGLDPSVPKRPRL